MKKIIENVECGWNKGMENNPNYGMCNPDGSRCGLEECKYPYREITDEDAPYQCSMALEPYLIYTDDNEKPMNYCNVIKEGTFIFQHNHRNITAEIYHCGCNGWSIKIEDISPYDKLLTMEPTELLCEAVDSARKRGLIDVNDIPKEFIDLNIEWDDKIINTIEPNQKLILGSEYYDKMMIGVKDVTNQKEITEGNYTHYEGDVKRMIPVTNIIRKSEHLLEITK